MVGDLVGTWISIGRSETEAALMRLTDKVEMEVAQARYTIPRRMSRHLTERIDPVRGSIESLGAAVGERLDELERRIAVAGRPAAAGIPAWAGAGWVLAGILAIAALIRRRRAPAVRPSEPRWGDVEWVVPEREEVSSRT